jgi:hypothetical protein
LAARCNRYYKDHAFPVALDYASRRILLKIGRLIGAVTVPATIADKVLTRLDIALASGPVVVDSHENRWIFLTGSRRAVSGETAADLFRLGATVHSAGDDAVLPSPEDERLGLRRWQRQPVVGRDLPQQSLVIATIRLVGAARR